MTSLREKWAAGGRDARLVVVDPELVTAEITARQPVDYVCIDTAARCQRLSDRRRHR